MAIQAGGAESALVTDAAKFKCHVCGGTHIQLTMLGDEPEDITQDSTLWATIAVENATKRTCSVVLCSCGREQILQVFLFDNITATGAETTPDMTNLDATTADGLAGWWLVLLVGTQINKYIYITSNTLAAPTVLTLPYTRADDSDGLCYITNIEPIGLTRIVA